jgi:hypothetical protein
MEQRRGLLVKSRVGSGRSFSESTQRLGVPGRFLVEHPVKQVGTTMLFEVRADRLPCDLLHRAAL